MKGRNQIGNVTLKIEPDAVKQIANSGRLEDFVDKATELFRLDLKAELVKEAVSSVETALYIEDDDFGTGPRPPHWHNIAVIEKLAARIENLEMALAKVGR